MTTDEINDLPYEPSGRFKKGHSQNPKGRKRKLRSIGATIAGAFEEKVQVTEGGRRRRVTKLQAAAIQIANKSASGDSRSAKLAFELAQKAEERQNLSQPEPTHLSETDQQIADRFILRLRKLIGEENNVRDVAANVTE